MHDQDETEQPPEPPRQDEYPPGALVAVVDDLHAAHDAVSAARFASASEPYVIIADRVQHLRDARDDDQGILKRLYLTLGAMLSDQRALEDRYLEEARLGHHMVVASASDEAQADVVWGILKSHGAHTGAWFGSATIRELV